MGLGLVSRRGACEGGWHHTRVEHASMTCSVAKVSEGCTWLGLWLWLGLGLGFGFGLGLGFGFGFGCVRWCLVRREKVHDEGGEEEEVDEQVDDEPKKRGKRRGEGAEGCPKGRDSREGCVKGQG